MSNAYSSAVETARKYYNSDDADNFYFTIWGGQDIHIGLYDPPNLPITQASRKTVERMAQIIEQPNKATRILDLGAGYGGAARYLAKNHHCQVVALNLSEVENQRNRDMNQADGLDQNIEVIDASFENIPCPDESFDVVWSQDAILHSGEREKVITEVARVLKPGGQFIFTDPMAADDADQNALKPILDRIHLQSLGSTGFYKDACQNHGLSLESFEDLTSNLPVHYAAVLNETARLENTLSEVVTKDYLARMKVGLQHWIDGGHAGQLTWGIFHFRKNA